MVITIPEYYDPKDEMTWPVLEYDISREHFESILIEPEDIENEITLKELLEKNGLGQYHRTDAQDMWDNAYGWMDEDEKKRWNVPPRPTTYNEEEDKIWFAFLSPRPTDNE